MGYKTPNKITIKDKTYGSFTVKSPAIIELLSSKPIMRLKNIAQFGIPDEFYHLKNFSRFEHSLGVMLLLKKLEASEEEQIAGLLHDISHTAFSHVIDSVLKDGKTEDFQDSQHKQFVNHSEIPSILKKYGYSTARICDYKHFCLLEREIPDICADRLDYSLREMPPLFAKQCFADLTTHQGKIVFKNQSIARLFAENFLKIQTEHWGGFEAVTRYQLFANALRRALKLKIITLDNFWKDDAYIINKIKKTTDSEIRAILKMLRKKSLQNFPKDTAVTHKKFRYVDPELFINGRLVRLSKIDKVFKRKLTQALKENTKGIHIAVLKKANL